MTLFLIQKKKEQESQDDLEEVKAQLENLEGKYLLIHPLENKKSMSPHRLDLKRLNELSQPKKVQKKTKKPKFKKCQPLVFPTIQTPSKADREIGSTKIKAKIYGVELEAINTANSSIVKSYKKLSERSKKDLPRALDRSKLFCLAQIGLRVSKV